VQRRSTSAEGATRQLVEGAGSGGPTDALHWMLSGWTAQEQKKATNAHSGRLLAGWMRAVVALPISLDQI